MDILIQLQVLLPLSVVLIVQHLGIYLFPPLKTFLHFGNPDLELYQGILWALSGYTCRVQLYQDIPSLQLSGYNCSAIRIYLQLYQDIPAALSGYTCSSIRIYLQLYQDISAALSGYMCQYLTYVVHLIQFICYTLPKLLSFKCVSLRFYVSSEMFVLYMYTLINWYSSKYSPIQIQLFAEMCGTPR